MECADRVSVDGAQALKSSDQLMRFGAANDEEICRVMVAVQAGQLDVEGALDGKRRIGVMLFACAAVEALKGVAEIGAAPWLTVPQVADTLHVKQEVAYHLVHVGLLPASSSRQHGRAASLVHRRDVQVFQTRYAFGREIAMKLGKSPKAFAAWARELGLNAVSGPGVDQGRQLVYERSHAEERCGTSILALACC